MVDFGGDYGRDFNVFVQVITPPPPPSGGRMAYNPPIKGSSISIPYLSMVATADPDYQSQKRREREYEMSNKVFLADNNTRGAYNQFSNVYPTGQPNGPIDPLYAGRPFYSTSGSSSNTRG